MTIQQGGPAKGQEVVCTAAGAEKVSKSGDLRQFEVLSLIRLAAFAQFFHHGLD